MIKGLISTEKHSSGVNRGVESFGYRESKKKKKYLMKVTW